MPEMRTLMTGLVFGESPRWHGGKLYGFDIATHEVFAVGPSGDDAPIVAREPAGVASIGFLEIGADGSLASRRMWADLPDAFPDGMCLDAEGAVWYADVPGKRCVRVAEGGDILGSIGLDRGCFACTLGTADGRTLFLLVAAYPPTAWGPDAPRTGQVLATEAPAPNAGWP